MLVDDWFILKTVSDYHLPDKCFAFFTVYHMLEVSSIDANRSGKFGWVEERFVSEHVDFLLK